MTFDWSVVDWEGIMYALAVWRVTLELEDKEVKVETVTAFSSTIARCMACERVECECRVVTCEFIERKVG